MWQDLRNWGLKAMHDGVGDVIDDVNSGRMSFTEGMNELVSRELARSRKRRTESIVAVAHFPSVKTFEQFDFSFQPGISVQSIIDL